MRQMCGEITGAPLRVPVGPFFHIGAHRPETEIMRSAKEGRNPAHWAVGNALVNPS